MKKIFSMKIFFICLAICSVVVAFAYAYNNTDIGFTPDNSDWEVDNTKDALDDLNLRIQGYSFAFEKESI